MLEQVESTLERVRDLLKKYPKCRDDDKYLFLIYIYFYSDIRMLGDLSFQRLVERLEQPDIPQSESISRARRVVQNKEGLYLGTRQTERKEAAEEMRQGMHTV